MVLAFSSPHDGSVGVVVGDDGQIPVSLSVGDLVHADVVVGTIYDTRQDDLYLELHPTKIRLIEFGRYAARNRKARGLGNPETFDFLGFSHICGKTSNGGFWLRRITVSKRMRMKLTKVGTELMRRRHLPIPEQGHWLASVVRGHANYYIVPGNLDAVAQFRTQVTRYWFKALRRHSQRHRLNWENMARIAGGWLPSARNVHHTCTLGSVRGTAREGRPHRNPNGLLLLSSPITTLLGRLSHQVDNGTGQCLCRIIRH